MTEIQNSKHYDLEERTLKYASRIRIFVKRLSRTIANTEDSIQLVRASGSVGANYIEANESFSKKDFILRVKMCRKEAKESRYWLQLVSIHENLELAREREELIKESTELMNIFGSIIHKSQ